MKTILQNQKKNLIAQLVLALILISSPLTLISQNQIGSDIFGEAANDLSGFAVSMSDNGQFVAIGAFNNTNSAGAAGSVRVYEDVAGVWTQVGQDIDGDVDLESSGFAVSISADGTIVAIGSPDYKVPTGEAVGRLRIFENIAGTWTQIGSDITGTGDGDAFGNHVSLSHNGNYVSAGALFNSDAGNEAGHVKVYENVGGNWVKRGQTLVGTAAGDRTSNHSLSANGEKIAVASLANADNGNLTGKIRVFEYDFFFDEWLQVGQDINGLNERDQLGSGGLALSDDGNVVGVGVPFADITNLPGLARIYNFNSGTNMWEQVGADIESDLVFGTLGNGTGLSLSPNGDTVAIGIPGDASNLSLPRGSLVRIYKNQSGNWVKVGDDIESVSPLDNFGWSVSMSGNDKVAIGGYLNGGNGANSGNVRVYDISAGTLSLENEAITTSEIVVYPNPVFNQLNVSLRNDVELESIVLYNVLGKEVKTSNTTTIDVSYLSSGLYLAKINTTNGSITKKVTVE
ncbi:T9SS type A sorting domain-containing protein [Flavivirga abyssicola]|uniref:T9SS type A sorting domain-containing protein n=1 Tax=Flavivirga abyssicola TaxID=3063533 RepID=UPI0026DEFEAB|nr:T9SS type A sorting domain-containing protein [Flavivirga sp. MEBiC07777]WVK13389.1 T9SS type A sorting domain-containing protein [Flavivirga sp. MEBiC07777]